MNYTNVPLKLLWQGLANFDVVLKNQLQKVTEVREGGEGCVIACEHRTVITLGKRSHNFNDLLIPIKYLREKNIEIYSVDRGGHATLHNPGQLVIYPIIPLRRYGLTVRKFVEILEVTTALLLAEYGLEVTRGYEPGLWVNDKKIAAFGIRVDRGVTYHGLALNVFNDLEHFKSIRQCGALTKATNMETEMLAFMPSAPQFHMEDMAKHWLKIFAESLATAHEMLHEETKAPVDPPVETAIEPAGDRQASRSKVRVKNLTEGLEDHQVLNPQRIKEDLSRALQNAEELFESVPQKVEILPEKGSNSEESQTDLPLA